MCECKRVLQSIQEELEAEMKSIEDTLFCPELLSEIEKKILMEKKDTLGIIIASINKALKKGAEKWKEN